eukprot:759369-Hanusia_phi.AAC.3
MPKIFINNCTLERSIPCGGSFPAPLPPHESPPPSTRRAERSRPLRQHQMSPPPPQHDAPITMFCCSASSFTSSSTRTTWTSPVDMPTARKRNFVRLLSLSSPRGTASIGRKAAAEGNLNLSKEAFCERLRPRERSRASGRHLIELEDMGVIVPVLPVPEKSS